MADKLVRLVSPGGAKVSTSAAHADYLRQQGFTEAKAPAKKSAAKKSSK
jgi:hypothetical protein